MTVWNGDKKDITNCSSDSFLKINSCGFQNVLSGHTVIREKGRYDYHILLINSGRCRVLHKTKVYTLTEGNFVLYAPGEKQEYTFESESTSLWCHFSGRIVEELLTSCNITSGVYFFQPNRKIFEAYSNLIQRFHQPGMENYANVSFLELVYGISNAAVCFGEKEKSDLILPILTYINANYNKQITLDELAAKSGYSKSRFSHVFSEFTGTTPIKYQNNIRLNASCEMLSSTELTIAAVAYSCGFSDPLYYSKLFKRKYHLTPTEYRQRMLNF